MKKRVLSFLMAAVMLLSITASIIPSVNADEALPSYNICDDFKSEVFSYGTRNLSNGAMTTMSWNETQKMYQSGSNFINSGFLSAGDDPAVCSVVTFTAPYTGKITVASQTVLDAGYEVKGIINRGKLWSSDYSVCYAQVYKNSFANQLANYSLPANNTPVVVDDIVDIEVTAGDRIMFMVGSNTAKNSYIEWLPDITYTKIAHEHTWAETMSSDADYHWYDCTAADCDITDNASKEGYGAHADADINGVCDVCGYAMPIVLAKYNLFNDFGNEVFGYSTRNVSNGTMTTMSWNETQKMYQSGSNFISAGFLSAGNDPAVCSVVTFTAPYTGKITITADSVVAGITNRGKLWSSDYAECYAQIFHNSFANGIKAYNLPANNTVQVVDDITMNITVGDRIMFMVGSNAAKNSYIEWLPEIVYTEIAHSHVWAETMSSDEDYHWYDCTAADCDIVDNASKEGYGAHADEDINGVCDACGHAVPIVLAKYNLFNDFGNEVFGYSTRNVANGAMTAMSWNETRKMYQSGSNFISAGFLSAGDDPAVCSVVTFTAPYTGKITITADSVVAGITNRGKLWSSDYAECYAQIFYNSFANGIMGYNLPANNTTLVVEDITMNVTAGDRIMFMVGSNTAKNSYIEWLPEIVYTEIAHIHAWAETMSSDEDYHWYDCTAEDCDIADNASKEGYGAHIDEDINGACDACGYAMPIVLAKYNLFNDFGNEVFGYSIRNVSNGTMSAMSWNETQKMYQNGSNFVNAGFLSAGNDPAVCSVVTFTAPYTGKITITADSVVAGITNRGKLWSSDYAECYAQIFHNSFANGIMGYNLPANNTTLVVEDITMNVTAGDRIMFMVGSNTAKNSYIEWLPEIVYNCILDAKVEEYNVSLGDDLNVNFVLDIAVEDVATTKVNVTVANTQTSYNAADLLVDGKYVVTAELAAAQMTEKVNVQIVTDDLQTFNKDYSVRQYADFILDEANGYSAEVKALVEAMLHYGAAAQGYFDVNTTTLANDGYTDTVTNEIPVLSDYSLLPTGTVDGITFYGASLLFKSKTAVRFYFSCDDASTYTFTIGSDAYTATEKEAGLWYVEIGEIVPQDLDAEITVVVSDAEGNALTVGYSPMHYIVRQFNKTADETLKVLLQNLYDYHVAAEALKAA